MESGASASASVMYLPQSCILTQHRNMETPNNETPHNGTNTYFPYLLFWEY